MRCRMILVFDVDTVKVGDEMAWISVHESVDGPKLRNLYKKLGCSKFEAVGILNFLWFWGLTNADKSGLILCADKEDVSRYLYGAGTGCKLPPDAIADALIDAGWLDDTPDGIFIHDWETWQEQWYKAQERREADAERKRKARKAALDAANDTNSAELKKKNEERVIKGEMVALYTADFERFWKAYPRHADKGMAYKQYRARINAGFSEEQMLLAANAYAAQCVRNGTEKRYIKHATTFLGPATPFVEFLPNSGIADTASEQLPDESNPFDEYGRGD